MRANDFIKSHKLLLHIVRPIRWLKHLLLYNPHFDKKYIRNKFVKKHGYIPNLIAPQTFSEKIQWVKLFQRDRLITALADKLGSRDYVREKVGADILIPLHLVSQNVSDISLNSLPDYPVVIKTNHASGKVFIVRDKPNQLQAMLSAAKLLAAEFNYLRVDLYATPSNIYFGELTFTPGAGFALFNPLEMDKIWGSYFTIGARGIFKDK